MLTFGLIFPLLAIISTTIVMCRITSQYICDRYLYNIIYYGRKNRQSSSRLYHYIDKLDHECHGVINETVIKNAFWIILLCSSSFYSFFLFDTLGDDLGFRKSFWILIVTTLIPCYVYIIEVIYNYLCHRNDNQNRNSSSKNNNINDMSNISDRASNDQVPIIMNNKGIKSAIVDKKNDYNYRNEKCTGSLHGNSEIMYSFNRESINTIIEMNRTRRSSNNNNNVENIVRDINPGNDDDYDVEGDVVADANTSSSTTSASKEEIPESTTGGIELTQTKSSNFT